MIKLTDAQWDAIKDAYIPEDLKEKIETDNWAMGIKGEKCELKIPIISASGENLETVVKAEKLSEFWFITQSLEDSRKYSLTHVEGAAAVKNLKSRKKIIELWGKLKRYDIDLPIHVLKDSPEFYDIHKTIQGFL